MKRFLVADALKLKLSERIRLVEDIWDSIAAIPKAVALTSSQRDELDKRLKAHRKNPSAASPWKTVKTRILARG